MEYAIETENLTKSFGVITAVDRLNLKIKKGEIFGLFGPDGAGKTTAIRLLTTILKPTSGTAKIAGYHLIEDAKEIRKRIGYMSQRFNLYGDLTVDENLLFFADLFGVKGKKRDNRIKELLSFSNLTQFRKRRAEHLSGGMKQKLALSCTLLHEPEIIFLDEPTTGVDPISRRELWKIISDLHLKKVTLFITTPYLDEAERCNKVAFMDKGKIILIEKTKKIKERVKGDFIEIVASPPKKVLKVIKEINDVIQGEIFVDRIQAWVKNVQKAIPLISKRLKQEGFEIRAIHSIQPSMENVFIQIMRELPKKDERENICHN